MAEILYAPDRDRVVTTNAWAFLHWLRLEAGADLDGWRALQRWSVAQPQAFRAAVAGFAGAGFAGAGFADTGFGGSRRAAAATPARLLADLLLHADLRPDDAVVVAGPVLPWLPARHWGTSVVQAATGDVLAAAEKEHATVLVAPAQALATAGFRRPRRPDLAGLRSIVATGGPLSPEARRRIYTGVKSDVMLLARTGETLWGNPLEPVLASPPATPAFLTPPPSAPAPR